MNRQSGTGIRAIDLKASPSEALATTANPTAGNPSANADADDNAGDDEEAVSIFPPLSAAMVGQTYTLPVGLSGASKAAAFSQVNEVISYKIVVKNTGNVTLGNLAGSARRASAWAASP